MTGMTLREIVSASNALWTGDEALLEQSPVNIVTDSRAVEPGSLFIAFRGERVDAHRFIPEVLQKGALAVLCEEAGAPGEPRIVVPEVFAAMRAAAKMNRDRADMRFIGITGSVGKTTAKEMMAAVLSAHYRTFRTPGNANGQVGTPITFMSLTPGYELGVMEMAISIPGEMAKLGALVRPDMGVFMNIADAHLEALHDRQGILREKCEMLSHTPPEGPVFINGDDPLLRGHDFGHPVTSFGLGESCDVRAVDVRSEGEGQSFTVVSGERRFPVRIDAYGSYMIYAALAAAAVALHLGLTEEEIRRGMLDFRTVGHRSRVVHTHLCTLVDDAYNANPAGNRAAIDSLAAIPGRRVCFLGDMREMGPDSPRIHRELGEYIAAHGVDALYTEGEDAAFITEGAAGVPGRHFPDRASMLAALPELLRKGDAVLVKASRGAGFENVSAAIEKL